MHWVPWLSVVSTVWLQECHWSSCCLCTHHLMRIRGCEAHCLLQCRHVHTLPYPMEQFTITTFLPFFIMFITFATSWTDMHWVPLLFIIITAWLQQCHWSNRCLCRQHLMRNCGCKAHCSLQCRPTQTLPCPVQHFINTIVFVILNSSSRMHPAGLTCIESHCCGLAVVSARIF